MNEHTDLDIGQSALALAKQGLRVFPLTENGKIPAISGWPQKATTDIEKIHQWWKHDPLYNAGVLCGEQPDGRFLTVLDVDTKEGRKGAESLAALQLLYDDLPETYEVETASGGRHLYFFSHLPTANTASKLGDGLDTRGHHGFVVAPGSLIDGKLYKSTEHTAIAELPAAITAQIKARKRDPKSKIIEGLHTDTQPSIDRAKSYLQTADPAIEGQGGDAHTYKVACQIMDLGISQLTALELMADHWNERCQPPWDFDALAQKVTNAATYREKPIGINDAQADFDAVSANHQDPAPVHRMLQFGEIHADLDQTHLIEDLLDTIGVGFLWGESGSRKTQIAVDMGLAIAQGNCWCGREVMRGGVILSAGEAPVGIERRIEAIRTVRALPSNLPFAMRMNAFPLSRSSERKSFVQDCRDAASGWKVPLRLIIIDTLTAHSGTNSINEPDDAKKLVNSARSISNELECYVLIIHHPGKNQHKGMREAQAMTDAAEAVLKVVKHNRNDRVSLLTATKQRDNDATKVKHVFEGRVHEFPPNMNGKVITAPYVDPRETSAVDDFFDGPAANTPQEQTWLDQVPSDASVISAKEHKAAFMDAWRERNGESTKVESMRANWRKIANQMETAQEVILGRNSQQVIETIRKSANSFSTLRGE